MGARRATGMTGRRIRIAVVAALAIAGGVAGTAVATAWTVSLNAGSAAQGQSPAAPPAPATPTSACSTGTKVTVSWTAVTGAKSYSVYKATSTSGPWTLLGSVTAPTVTYTSAAITPAGTYYFAVTMTTNDTNWPASTQSAASAARTITATSCA